MKLISIELQSDFGFFRKPEMNNTLNVTYNMLHKPALLGILGAIIGLKGYEKKGVMPEYYEKLHNVEVGIAPLNHESGNFAKTAIRYSNTVGYANKGTTFLTEELTLIAPKYKVFLLLDESNSEHHKLIEYLKKGDTEYIPYFGKNEFTAWWYPESFREYEFEDSKIGQNEEIRIKTLFLKNQVLKDSVSKPVLSILDAVEDEEDPHYMYFERLPVDFNLELFQYNQQEIVFTNYLIENGHSIPNLYLLKNLNSYVQLI